jgi:hypothetical protein
MFSACADVVATAALRIAIAASLFRIEFTFQLDVTQGHD